MNGNITTNINHHLLYYLIILSLISFMQNIAPSIKTKTLKECSVQHNIDASDFV